MASESLFKIFEPYPHLVASISTRTHGSLRLGSKDPKLQERRNDFLKEIGIEPERHVAAGLIHSIHATPVNWIHAGHVVAETDGLLTREPNLFLSVTVADCLPIYLYDPQNNIAGLLHAGWHSLTNGMIPAALRQLQEIGGSPTEVLVGIGPSIGSCHFEIHPNLKERFAEYSEMIEERDGRLFVDLKNMAKRQLEECGVSEGSVELNKECTHCLQDKYFSNRRDKPQEVEAMMAVIGMRST